MDGLRLSDADRDAAVHQLGEQYAEGRLTKDELDERSDAVWSARTRGDLAPVFADLPRRADGARVLSQSRGRRRLPRPLVALLLVVVAIAVLTHLPFLLVALGLWFVLARCHHGPRSGRRALHG